MNRYMHEEYYSNPELFRRLAERERAEAIGKAAAWLYGAIGRILTQAAARLRPRGHGGWIERLG